MPIDNRQKKTALMNVFGVDVTRVTNTLRHLANFNELMHQFFIARLNADY